MATFMAAGVQSNPQSYTLDGQTHARIIGNTRYTFSGIPQQHPMRLETAIGYASCAPALETGTAVTIGNVPFYWGTVTYNTAGCPDGSAVRFRCGNHGLMNGGTPLLIVHAAC